MDVLLPRDDETRVLLYEVYRDDDALDVHRAGTSIARFREEAKGVKVQATKCAVLAPGGGPG